MCKKNLTVLGIESSCDETAAAVVSSDAAGQGQILSNVVFDQTAMHANFAGVVPEIAARAHAERLDIAIEQAMAEAAMALPAIDAIAVTAGPGLIGGVMSGVLCATGLARAADKPLLGINHLEGHALTPRLSDGVAFPFLLLLVSGGHCQFLLVRGVGDYRRLGGTIDDAPGEAFDKVAKMLGLGFPGGPDVERWADKGAAGRFDLPRPLLNRPGCDMSFSGLKTAVLRARDALVAKQGGLYRRDLADLCHSFQDAVGDVLARKAERAIAASMNGVDQPTAFAIAGGVAANRHLRERLETTCAGAGLPLIAPPLRLCTDNGAMIAWAGIERLAVGLPGAPARPRPRWPLDETAAPMLGSGKRGAKA